MTDNRFKYSNVQPFEIVYEGIDSRDGSHHKLVFKSVENFYQAMKTTDWAEREKISKMPWRHAKAYASKPSLPGKRDMKVWDSGLKYQIMEWALRRKFAPGTVSARILALDDGELIEYNTWHDNEWGDCTCWQQAGNYGVKESCRVPGRNNLGKILTRIREELRQNIYVSEAVRPGL